MDCFGVDVLQGNFFPYGVFQSVELLCKCVDGLVTSTQCSLNIAHVFCRSVCDFNKFLFILSWNSIFQFKHGIGECLSDLFSDFILMLDGIGKKRVLGYNSGNCIDHQVVNRTFIVFSVFNIDFELFNSWCCWNVWKVSQHLNNRHHAVMMLWCGLHDSDFLSVKISVDSSIPVSLVAWS